eukprot:g22476.t1
MDPEALKRLQVELEELCQSHQAELHRCVANFAISLNNAEKRGQEGLLAVERVPQPPRLGRLEPLKPHSWTKLAGEKLTSNTDAWHELGLAGSKLPQMMSAPSYIIPEDLSEPKEPTEPTESTEPSLPHVPASETGNFPSEASSGSGLAGADGAGNPPRRIPRLQKLASSHGVAMRAAAIRNMQLAVKEAKDSKEAKEETQEEKPNVDFNCPEAMIVVESRASLSSNFSDAGRRTSMMSDQAADEGDGAASSSPGASGETQVDEDGDGHVAENRQGRRALVESKSLAALPPSVLKVAEDNGISQKHMRKSAFLASEMLAFILTEQDSQTIWQRIVTSSTYESLSGAFILLNCGFVAWQTQAKAVDDEWRAETYQELTMAEPVLFNVIQGVFTIVFAVDLVFRILADRSFFVHYKNKEFLWNVMDSFVVTFDLVSIFLEVWVQFGLLRMMRVLRIVRVVKIIRVMKSFAELRMLMYSIVSCIKSLVWVIAVLVLNMGLFAVLFTSATGSELDTGEKRRDPKFEKLVMLGTVRHRLDRAVQGCLATAREAEHLFNLLDYDGSGEVSYPEFSGEWRVDLPTKLLVALCCQARSLDVKIIQLEVTALSKALKSVQDQMAGKERLQAEQLAESAVADSPEPGPEACAKRNEGAAAASPNAKSEASEWPSTPNTAQYSRQEKLERRLEWRERYRERLENAEELVPRISFCLAKQDLEMFE